MATFSNVAVLPRTRVSILLVRQRAPRAVQELPATGAWRPTGVLLPAAAVALQDAAVRLPRREVALPGAQAPVARGAHGPLGRRVPVARAPAAEAAQTAGSTLGAEADSGQSELAVE